MYLQAHKELCKFLLKQIAVNSFSFKKKTDSFEHLNTTETRNFYWHSINLLAPSTEPTVTTCLIQLMYHDKFPWK